MSESAETQPAERLSTESAVTTRAPGKTAWVKWLPLGAGVLSLLALFFIWPYQHWSFSTTVRTSVINGWVRVINESFNGEWMFCFVVPFIVGFLVRLRREELRSLPVNGHWAGALMCALGLFIYWVGYKADTGYGGFLAAQIITGGLVLLLGGWRWMRALFFPWLFLAFMWPMFPIEERVVSKLRLITAGTSAEVMKLMGIAVVREGTALSSMSDAARNLAQGALFSLDVEEPCSGVRSLYSLLMVSALYGYLSLRGMVPRIILFASAVPLAMAGNVVRMVLLAVGSLWFGMDFAVGRNLGPDQHEMSVYHTLAGYAVFAVALVGMFTLCSLLETSHWKRLKGVKKRLAGKTRAAHEAGAPAGDRRICISSIAAIVITAGGLAICAMTDVNPTIADPGVVLELPLQFGKYQGQEMKMTAVERNILDKGVDLARCQYLSTDQHMMLATVIQSGMGGRTLHRPEVCLPGQGWNITERLKIPVKLDNGRTVQATLLRMHRDYEPSPGTRKRMRALNLYWYIGSDGTTSDDYYDHIRISYIDAVFHNLAHRWAMASFFVPMPETEVRANDPMEEVGALGELRDFAGGVAPKFMKELKK